MFGVSTVVIECTFTDSKNRIISIQFILSEKETCLLAVEYAESCADLSMIDWITDRIGGVVTIEGVRNFLNGLGIESQMDVSIMDI